MKSVVIALPQPEQQTFSSRAAAFIRSYGLLIFFTAVMLSGLVLGVVKGDVPGKADKLFLPLPTVYEELAPLAVFADSFSSSFIFSAALCFLALTPAGLPAIPALVFFRGYELGILSGYLCLQYGFSGFAYFISVILAGGFLSSLALLYLSQYCIGCSAYIMLALAGHLSDKPMRDRFRELLVNVAYSLIMLVFASLTDTLLYCLIGRLF